MTAPVRIEGKWIAMFEQVFGLCGVKAGDACAVLSETQTRPELPQLAGLALLRMGARPFHVVLPAQPLTAPVPVTTILVWATGILARSTSGGRGRPNCRCPGTCSRW